MITSHSNAIIQGGHNSAIMLGAGIKITSFSTRKPVVIFPRTALTVDI